MTKPIDDTTDILDHLRAATHVLFMPSMSSNTFAGECLIQRNYLERAIKEIEHLRSVAGAITDGDSFADIRKAIKQS